MVYGNYNVAIEDCLTTLERMEDDSVDLVVTSPPYNMNLRIRNILMRSYYASTICSYIYIYIYTYIELEGFGALGSLISSLKCNSMYKYNRT